MSVAAAPGEVRRYPAFAVDTVDTLAAGDVFHGAYALALAEGRRNRRCDPVRCRCRGIKCSRPG